MEDTDQTNCTPVRQDDRCNYLGDFQMLEFNMPVHENWNIVHIAMQVPESHQIYVCPENCARGVVMTAYEMGAEDRFSCVTVNERDLIIDNLETITIDGCCDVIDELRASGHVPRVIFLFTVCSHRMLSCDFDFVFRTLRERYPDIIFAHGYMDCIAQKEGPMPDEKLRREMYGFVPESHTDEKIINIIGSEVTATAENNDLIRMMGLYPIEGVRFRQLSDISTFDDYMRLGDACLNICQYRAGDMGVREFSRRLGIPYFYALPYFDDESMAQQLLELDNIRCDCGEELGIWINEYLNDFNDDSLACREDYRQFAAEIGDMPVVLDYMAVNCPYSLAEYLLENGFNVRAVVADGPADYEKEIHERLMEKYPSVISVNPVDPRLREELYRTRLRGGDDRILAIGPRAAWVYNTPYFVNQIENDGAYGVAGWRTLLQKMREAVQTPKDLEGTVSRKALGLPSCIR